MSLTMFSAVSRSISSAFSRPTAVWCATARRSSASSSSNVRSRAMQQSRPSCSSPAASGAIRSSSSTAPGAPAAHQRHQLRRAGRAVGAAGRVGAGEVELVRVRVDAPDLTRVGAEQLPRAARDGVVEILAERDGRERLAQLGERRERLDAPARALVELRVLDRAGDERRGVHEEVEHSVVELARRLGMEDDHTDHVAVAREHGHGDHRLELLLLELRHVLHARVVERVVADELGRLRARDPAGEPLADPPAERADQVRVARRRGPQHQPVALHEVDEAGVTAGRVGRDLDDTVQHALQVERRRDRLDDRVERLVFALYAGQGVAAARHR